MGDQVFEYHEPVVQIKFRYLKPFFPLRKQGLENNLNVNKENGIW